MKRFRRLTLFILVAIMVIAIVPTTALADNEAEDFLPKDYELSDYSSVYTYTVRTVVNGILYIKYYSLVLCINMVM